jgi:hypothetical protein
VGRPDRLLRCTTYPARMPCSIAALKGWRRAQGVHPFTSLGILSSAGLVVRDNLDEQDLVPLHTAGHPAVLANSDAAGADRLPDEIHDQRGAAADEKLACPGAQGCPAVEDA